MNVAVCVCCGQPIAEKGRHHSRNPNICTACSDLAAGLETQDLPKQTEAISTKPELPKEIGRIRKAA